MATTITNLPAYPTQEDNSSTFETKAQAFVAALADVFVGEVNTLAGELEDIYDDFVSMGNYSGEWGDLTGALNIPAAVHHDGVLWLLLSNLADVTTSEPSDTNSDWKRASETRSNFSNIVLDGSIKEKVHTLSGTSVALDPANGTIQSHTLTGNTTYSDGLENGESMALFIDDGTSYTASWPTITWITNAGSAPTLTSTGYTVVMLIKFGSTLYGFGKGEE